MNAQSEKVIDDRNIDEEYECVNKELLYEIQGETIMDSREKPQLDPN